MNFEKTEAMVTEKGIVYDISELCPRQFHDIVDGKVFQTMQDMHYTLLALSRGASKYALEHGLACPADTRHAVEYCKSLKSFR